MQDLDFLFAHFGNKFKRDKLVLEAYSYDSSRVFHTPLGVFLPENIEDISSFMKICYENNIKVTPRGNGTSMSSGAIATDKEIILSLTKMNNILDINKIDMSVKVQAGIINGKLNQELKKDNMFVAIDPASSEFSTIGGNISTNAGGMSAVKYGVTKDNVLSLKVVLADGRVLNIGRNLIKDVAGFDIKSLIIGSEGVLCIVVEATLKTRMIKPKRSSLISFAQEEDAINFASKLLGYVTPLAIEFIDRKSLEALNSKYHNKFKDIKSLLIVSFEFSDILELELIRKQIENLEDYIKIEHSNSENEEANIWLPRKTLSQSMSYYGDKKINIDFSIPRSKLIEFYKNIIELEKQYKYINIATFGHIGDSNIHTNILYKSEDESKFDKDEVTSKAMNMVISLGGSITGEHGVGQKKLRYMKDMFDKDTLDLFNKIKDIFDDKNILNPNKAIKK